MRPILRRGSEHASSRAWLAASIPIRRLFVLVSLLFALPTRAAPMFVPLGVLPGMTQSQATAVSDDGSTVVGDSSNNSSSQAFRWTQAGGMQGLGDWTAYAANAVSADGSVVAGNRWIDSTTFEAFRWTQATGVQGLGVLPDAFRSSAIGISADGSTVVGTSLGLSNQEAFRWTQAGGMQDLGVLSGDSDSIPRGVSADGSVVVATNYPPGEAFRWTEAGGTQSLGLAPGTSFNEASGVSADGSVIGGYSAGDTFEWFRWTEMGGFQRLGDSSGGTSAISADGSTVLGERYDSDHQEAARWTQAGGIQGLGILPGTVESYATAISADGSTIVGQSHSYSIPEYEVFVWDAAHGMRKLSDVLTEAGLDLTGWQLTRAEAISADGRVIVGQGSNPSGQLEGWLARLPELGECEDGVDNDGDGLIDYPADPGCDSPNDISEHSSRFACDDGVDNDGDGLIDFKADGTGDPGCPFPEASPENLQCDDGIDNDGNGLIDWADPKCSRDWPYWESKPCGLGAELGLVVPLLAAWRRRVRR